MLSAILCYLYDEERFMRNRRNLTGETYHIRFCKDLNEYDTLQSVRKTFDADYNSWTMIAVVRDPLERFVSGFADKCLREKVWKKFPDRCNRCKTNLTCFMERQYVRMMRWKSVYKVRASPDFDDDHFFPQNWRCEFPSHFHDYHKLHLDTSQPFMFIDKLLSILRNNNVSNTAVEYIRSSLTSGRTVHSTVDTVERKQTKELLLSNNYLRTLLIRMYFYDFVLFGYRVPREFSS
ncbi:unnamed protein product [Cylicocyclus nassatus]|uniref:Carbohydrate sulfotransferase n=1 Tax=Cylicocyclus nassatus TaxID=53992 RepID=A0AA36M3R6_CYLNA|nr:unnamed protein product [Cylicocyclus nassatus]